MIFDRCGVVHMPADLSVGDPPLDVVPLRDCVMVPDPPNPSVVLPPSVSVSDLSAGASGAGSFFGVGLPDLAGLLGAGALIAARIGGVHRVRVFLLMVFLFLGFLLWTRLVYPRL